MATDGAPAPGPPPNPLRRRPFLIGLGIGAIPLALSLVAGGLLTSANGLGQAFGTGVTLGVTAGALWVLLLLVCVVLLLIRATREVALGMLAAAVASPAIAYLGCGVILPRLLRPGP